MRTISVSRERETLILVHCVRDEGWLRVQGLWRMAYGVWLMASGFWLLASGLCLMAYG